jgi:hypothetical protein
VKQGRLASQFVSVLGGQPYLEPSDHGGTLARPDARECSIAPTPPERAGPDILELAGAQHTRVLHGSTVVGASLVARRHNNDRASTSTAMIPSR